MPGALMQIAATGAQDIYLTGNAQITFHKAVFRRYTNFAVESLECYPNGNVRFGGKTQVDITRNGDLIQQMYAHIWLPEVVYRGNPVDANFVEFAWVKRIGHAMFDELTLYVGNSTISHSYGLWMNIWYDLSHDVGKECGYDEMIGNTIELTRVDSIKSNCFDNVVLKHRTELYVPLQFYFCQNSGLALPLIALQYHTVRIDIEFTNWRELIIASDAFIAGNNSFSDNLEMTLMVNYVFLDNVERRRFAQVNHEYLIEQIQWSGAESINGSTVKCRLNFNHPIKALYWAANLGIYQGGKFMVYTPCNWKEALNKAAELLILSQFDLDENGYFAPATVDSINNNGWYSSSSGNGYRYVTVDPTDLNEAALFDFPNSSVSELYASGPLRIGRLHPNEPLMQLNSNSVDLRTKVSGIVAIVPDEREDGFFSPQVVKLLRNDLTIRDLSIPVTKFEYDNRADWVKRFDVTIWQQFNHGLYIDGSCRLITQVELFFNGNSRQSKRSAMWYDTVMPFERYSNTPCNGVGVFPFALHPEQSQPSGSANFSRIDNGYLNLDINPLLNDPDFAGVIAGNNNSVNVYGQGLNVLRMVSGMGGVAYNN